MGTEEKKPTEDTSAAVRPEKDHQPSSKPRLRGVFKFKTWEEKERWEKNRRDASLL